MIHGKSVNEILAGARADQDSGLFHPHQLQQGARRGAARRHLEAGGRSDRRQVLSRGRRVGGPATRSRTSISARPGRVDVKLLQQPAAEVRPYAFMAAGLLDHRARAAADGPVFPQVSVGAADDEVDCRSPDRRDRASPLIGGAFWIAGPERPSPRRRARAARDAALRRGATPPATTSNRRSTFERRVPVVGPAAVADVRDARATRGLLARRLRRDRAERTTRTASSPRPTRRSCC